MDLDWIKKSAEAGDSFYQVLLGFLFEHGFLAERDSEAAQEWYERAARQDFGPGQFALYELLFNEGDEDASQVWLRKATEAGDLAAQASLGSEYWRLDGSDTGRALAFKWMKSAADGGFCPAITNLALMYEQGVHVTPDPEEAKACLRRGAEKGDPACASMLAQRLLEDGASEPTLAEGLHWVREAAKGGDPFAFVTLSQIYRFGLHGVPQDEETAKIFDELAMSHLAATLP